MTFFAELVRRLEAGMVREKMVERVWKVAFARG
jgi:hypothetical protein